MMNQALDASNKEARMAQFRAETDDKEIARLRDELECSRRREEELTLGDFCRAFRRGKREIAEVMKNRRAQFSCDFREFKKSYQALGDYRECRGKRQRFRPSSDRGEVWKQWEPIPVSPDTVEAETGAPDEMSEVNQPPVPLNVNDFSMGGIDDRCREKDSSCHLAPCPFVNRPVRCSSELFEKFPMVRPRSNYGFRGCDDYFDLRFPYRFRSDSVPLKELNIYKQTDRLSLSRFGQALTRRLNVLTKFPRSALALLEQS
ncbi:hypothetical protein DY000_02040944 [Brassica cretica]|uniref:Uncharacterized protein n=1 Tax=Brassica cretica TaxID=69181 RepID=A0ABQ7BP24_BRACR|nr:hypothetical protein DY000_02040944 [Brassica cretica]